MDCGGCVEEKKRDFPVLEGDCVGRVLHRLEKKSKARDGRERHAGMHQGDSEKGWRVCACMGRMETEGGDGDKSDEKDERDKRDGKDKKGR